MTGWRANRTTLVAFVALAVVSSALAPCRCVLDVASCHAVEVPDAHGCCDESAGIESVSEDCCDSSLDPFVASTDVPEGTPSELRGFHSTLLTPTTRLVSAFLTHTPPPVLPDRTTVFLI